MKLIGNERMAHEWGPLDDNIAMRYYIHQ